MKAENAPLMPSPEGSKAQRLEQVLALIAQRHASAERAMLTTFGTEYFRQADPEDVCERNAEDLYGMVLSHLKLARQRTPGQPRLRVLNPTANEAGFASRHTVIEVVNDDMPFLVDSTTMEINRQGLTLHLIVHPVLVVQRDARAAAGAARAAPRDEADPTGRANRGCTSRSTAWSIRWRGRAGGRAGARARRCARRGARLAADAGAAARRHRRTGAVAAAGAAALAAGAAAFLQWLADDHLTLLGYRRHDLASEQGEDLLRLVPGSGLGVLREAGARGVGQLRRRPGAGAGHGARAVAAAAGDQGEHPLNRAPAGLQRLRRHQALQRRRRGDRRASLRRPVQLHRLQRTRRPRSRCCGGRWRR